MYRAFAYTLIRKSEKLFCLHFSTLQSTPLLRYVHLLQVLPLPLPFSLLLLDDKKSTDPCDIPVRLVKLSKNTICTYLADIFNHCIQNGVFPDKLKLAWQRYRWSGKLAKLAKVIPVFKSGAKDIASNYKPMSFYHTTPKYLKSWCIKTWSAS